MTTMLEKLVADETEARSAIDAAIAAIDEAAEADDVTDEAVAALEQAASDARERLDAAVERRTKHEAVLRSRDEHKPVPEERNGRGGIVAKVMNEPDMYNERSGGFLRDLYYATVKPSEDPAASDRINRHQAFEIEKRAVTTTLLGGILPPQYLVDMYAKAGRNGRVFADQVNHQTLPDVGMSVIVPRLTVGLTAGAQATENVAVTTSDPTEVDLSVPVRTLAGYSPVSRQTLERNAYGDSILFEDLIARYFALLDTQAINGSGAAGQFLGLLNTAGIATSSTATATVAALYPKIADVIQQINGNFGGLGYVADKIIMHPRRWGFFNAALDSSNRPLIVPQSVNMFVGPGVGPFNPIGAGDTQGYGLVGNMLGLPVYIDANVPTTLGGGTEDRIIVVCSQVSHLWERNGDPVTLSFEQTTGTALQVNLVCYGYAAFTAGRYPGACGAVSGAGLVTPTF